MIPKIGVLLPISEYYTVLASDFLNGLKWSFSTNDLPIPTILFEGIGIGTNDSILRTAEKMIIQEEVDVAVGFCGNESPRKTEWLVWGLPKIIYSYRHGGEYL